jgi:uncharacterized membrane protein HdeD (DUF308 family)
MSVQIEPILAIIAGVLILIIPGCSTKNMAAYPILIGVSGLLR